LKIGNFLENCREGLLGKNNNFLTFTGETGFISCSEGGDSGGLGESGFATRSSLERFPREKIAFQSACSNGQKELKNELRVSDFFQGAWLSPD